MNGQSENMSQMDSDDLLGAMTSSLASLFDILKELGPKSPLLAEIGAILMEGRARIQAKISAEQELLKALSLHLILILAYKKDIISPFTKEHKVGLQLDKDLLWVKLNKALEQYQSHAKEKPDAAVDFSVIKNLIDELAPWIAPGVNKNLSDAEYALAALEQFFPENLPTIDYECVNMHELLRRMAELKGEEVNDARNSGIVSFASASLADDFQFPISEEGLKKAARLKYQPLTGNFSVSLVTDDPVYLSNHYSGQGKPRASLGLTSRNDDIAKRIEEAIDFNLIYTPEQAITCLVVLMDAQNDSLIRRVIQGTMLDFEASKNHSKSRPYYQFQWSPNKKRINLFRNPNSEFGGSNILSIEINQKELNLCQS